MQKSRHESQNFSKKSRKVKILKEYSIKKVKILSAQSQKVKLESAKSQKSNHVKPPTPTPLYSHQYYRQNDQSQVCI